MRIGYARSSPSYDFPSNQPEALLRAGCSVVYEECADDYAEHYPLLEACLTAIEPGQQLVILDTRVLSSRTKRVADVMDMLAQKGARLIALRSASEADRAAHSDLALHMSAATTEFFENAAKAHLSGIPAGINDVAAHLDLLGVPPPPPKSWRDVPPEQLAQLITGLRET